MRYSIEPRDGFLSFAKNTSKKYCQKLSDCANKSTTDAIKSALKKAIQKTAEATADLTGNKIDDKIIKVSKTDENEIDIPKERYVS